MQVIPCSYLHSALWARGSLAQAKDKKARIHYAIAAVKGMSQAVVCALPALIFSTGRDRFTGSLSTVFVAVVGCFSTQAALHLHKGAVKNLEKDWEAFKDHLYSDCLRHVKKVKQLRLAQTFPEERCPVEGKLLFDDCAQRQLNGIKKALESFRLVFNGLNEWQIAERKKQVACKYIRRQKKRIKRLPMTFVEAASDQVKQAVERKKKAFRILGKAVECAVQKSAHSFDSEAFHRTLFCYMEGLFICLEEHIKQVKERQSELQCYWAAHAAKVSKKEELAVEEKINIQMWLVNHFGWLQRKSQLEKMKEEISKEKVRLVERKSGRKAVLEQTKLIFTKISQEAAPFESYLQEIDEGVEGLVRPFLGASKSCN